MRYLLSLLLLVTLPGCASTVGQVAGGVLSGGGSYLGSHIGGVTVSYDSTTGVYSGGLVFKDGRWIRGAGPATYARAAGECIDDAPKSISVALPVDNYGLRAIVDGGRGVRGLTGPLVSSKSISRAVAVSARAVREEEKETFKAIKELHEAEDHRLKLVIRATNPSMWGAVNRAFRGTPCIQPVASNTAPQAPVIDNYQPSNVTPPTIPEPNEGTGLGSGSIPPPRAMSNLESRVAALETNQKLDHDRLNGMDSKLDAILAAVKGK